MHFILEYFGYSVQGLHMSEAFSPVSHFFDNIQTKENGCIEWIGNKSQYGYGVFVHKGRVTPAHRKSYSMFVGEIPEGLLIRHKCNNRACVNPNHLLSGTHLDNMMDRKLAGRYRCTSRRKLSPEQVREIMDSSEASRVLAERLLVDRSMVDRIRGGYTYQDITNGVRSKNYRRNTDPLNQNARNFILTGPDGTELHITNLRRWCIENEGKFQIKPSKTPNFEKIMFGLTTQSGYQGWKAKSTTISQ